MEAVLLLLNVRLKQFI